jgi:hypothetical protein
MNDIYLGFPWIYHVADCFSLQQFMDTIFICLVVACVVAVQHCSLEQACPEAKATKKSIQTLGISWSASLAPVTTWTTTWSVRSGTTSTSQIIESHWIPSHFVRHFMTFRSPLHSQMFLKSALLFYIRGNLLHFLPSRGQCANSRLAPAGSVCTPTIKHGRSNLWCASRPTQCHKVLQRTCRETMYITVHLWKKLKTTSDKENMGKESVWPSLANFSTW